MKKITVQEASEHTGRLIAECPDWCTEEHDANEHPEDVRHRKVGAVTPWGEISIFVHPYPFYGSLDSYISVPDHVAEAIEGDITRDIALAMASALTAATVALDEVAS